MLTLKLLDAEGNVNLVRNEATIIENNSYKLFFPQPSLGNTDHYLDYTLLYIKEITFRNRFPQRKEGLF